MSENDFLSVEGARGNAVVISGEVRSGSKWCTMQLSAGDVWGHSGRLGAV